MSGFREMNEDESRQLGRIRAVVADMSLDTVMQASMNLVADVVCKQAVIDGLFEREDCVAEKTRFFSALGAWLDWYRRELQERKRRN
jgi:hypothetical protein